MIAVEPSQKVGSTVSPGHDATFFETAAWAQLIEETHGHADRSRAWRFEDGCAARLPLAALPSRWGILRQSISTVHGYGGPTGDDVTRHTDHLRTIAADLAADCRRGAVFHLVEDPTPRLLDGRAGALSQLVDQLGASWVHTFRGFSHILPLCADFDVVWRQSFDKKARNQYRKAVASGVRIRGSREHQAMDVFYSLYEASARRWNMTRPPFSRHFYARLQELAEDQLTVWLAHADDGSAVAASLCLYQGAHAFLWASALDKSLASLRPNDLLYGEMIRDACQRGCRVFDFGSGEGLASVQAFKEQFGAKRVDVSHFVVGHPVVLAVRRAVARWRAPS